MGLLSGLTWKPPARARRPLQGSCASARVRVGCQVSAQFRPYPVEREPHFSFRWWARNANALSRESSATFESYANNTPAELPVCTYRCGVRKIC